jgi:GDPmannose 4,6-dehydratase
LKFCPDARFYQASSSEMFGDSVDDDGFQRETTPMTPVSPYGCAKLFSYHLVRNYRASYGMFAANGILFNHESPRRGSNFVTSKIVKTAVQIKLGLAKELVLGNLDSHRDWGHSRDYVRAMHAILNHKSPDDFVIATGRTTSVREFLDLTFKKLDLDWSEFVRQDPKYLRPQELPYLKGDASKAKAVLGWEARESLETLVEEMIESWMAALESRLR